MKRSLLGSAILLGVLTFAGPAWAFTIDGGSIDVGGKDKLTKLGETTQLNGDAADLAWVKSILGDAVTFEIKNDGVTGGDWKQTDQNAGIWAFNLQGSPDFFLLKTGNNGVNDFRTFLFVNNISKDWAVLDPSLIYTAITNIEKVSYLSEFNSAPVPEPGTLLLLGAGLTGVALVRRFKK